MRIAILAPTVLAVAACSSGELREHAPPEMSPGTVTIRLLLPSTQTFCDQTNGCYGWQHIFVGSDPATLPEGAMQWWPSYAGSACAPQCANNCVQDYCPVPGIIPCPIQPLGVGEPVTNVETTWNGYYEDWSTCGANVACYNPHYLPRGRYYARMCVTPGTITQTDGSAPPTCVQTGAEECVDVAFDAPGPSLIEVPLPPIEGG